jgi:hypothetical protein
VTTEACTLALKSTLEEIKSVCPEVSNTFIFKPDQTIIAQDATTEETTLAQDAVKAFAALNGKAKGAAGGLDSITFLGVNRQVRLVRANSMFFAVVAKRSADEKILTVISRVLAPALLKTLQAVQPELAESETEEGQEIRISDEPTSKYSSNNSESTTNQTPQVTQTDNEPILPDAPVTQFMVETLHTNRLMGASDYVRIDNHTIETWKGMFGKKKIDEVEVEDTRTGKQQRFKFKPIKDEKLEGKGVIQIPEKAQEALRTKKGALVKVKPIIEQGGNGK